MPLASVIIRAKNEQALIGKVLSAVFEQTVRDIEVIVVDSGSTDRTIEIATSFPVRLIEIRPEQFTFGRALNIGCAAARGEFLVFISAHTVPLTTTWLECLLGHFDDPAVAGAWGKETNKRGRRPKVNIVRQDLRLFLSNHYFGFSNANGAIRADVWRRYRFHELLPASEDKEWAWRVLNDGYRLVHDSRALVWHYHDETLRQIWYRSHRENAGFAAFLELSPPSRREVLARVCEQAWRPWAYEASWRQRIGSLTAAVPHLIAREIGRYTGLRKGLPVREPNGKT